MARPPRLQDITAKTPPYASECMPKLGLATNLDFDYRVYVMGCTPPPGCSGPYYYVGIEHATRVGDRCVQHDEQRGSHFTKEHAPTKLHLLWPAANTAVEGYVYLALLSAMRQDSVAKLGGWTQTSAEPSPLTEMMFKQQWRLMRQVCFNCGEKNHWATDCKKALQGVTYRHTCNFCSKVNRVIITSRGQSQGLAPLPSKPLVPRENVSQKRTMQLGPSESSEPRSKIQRTLQVSPRSGTTVDVCGHNYSSLSWFTGCSNPSPSIVRRVREQCSESAVELENGDARTLVLHGFAAATPKKPPPLFGDRKTLPSEFTSTVCKAVRPRSGAFLKARRAKADSTRKANQILWRVSDLAKVVHKR